ncbi:MAG: SctD/MshK family protein, partial [Salinarimonas sp.]
EAQSALRTMLSAANLVPPLQLGSRDGVLTVTGALNAAERERAFEVMQGLRERHRVPIEISIESDPPAAPFVTAIVLSPETFVIGSDGRRYAPGQRLPDGGILEKIDDEAIVVNRNGLLERVNYAW